MIKQYQRDDDSVQTDVCVAADPKSERVILYGSVMTLGLLREFVRECDDAELGDEDMVHAGFRDQDFLGFGEQHLWAALLATRGRTQEMVLDLVNA